MTTKIDSQLSAAARGSARVDYVAGFMFSPDHKWVALIRKKPKRADQKWQTGLLNGIGGGIEPGEHPWDAMSREFKEETGVFTEHAEWRHFCTMSGADGTDTVKWKVSFYFSVGDLSRLQSMEEEKVVIANVAEISLTCPGMIENLPWLIALALDCLRDGRPMYARVEYP